MGHRNPLLWLLCIGLCASALANDAPGMVRVAIERKVGYVLGDLIPYDVLVTVDSSWTLRKSSLPSPGKPDYWLDLRSVDADAIRLEGQRTYRIHLVYQVFYAPLEARKRDLPGFLLDFDKPGGVVEVTVPALVVTLSPLREVATGTGDPEANVALEPDHNTPMLPLRGPIMWLCVSGVATLLLLMLMAWQRGIGPFARRAGAPFGRAERTLRKSRLSDAQSYAAGLLTLHRAFDHAAGWHVFADDLPRFLHEQPRFAPASAQIGQFFAASRLCFFGESPTRAIAQWPASMLSSLAKHLAELERLL